MKIYDIEKTTEGRRFVNVKLLPDLVKRIPSGGDVLFVGTETPWDYKNLFWNPSKLCNYVTMDKNESYKPDIVGSIEGCDKIKDGSFDLVILIGVYEYVNNKEGMFKEIYRILKADGLALLSLPGGRGLLGQDYNKNNIVEPWEVFEKIKPLLVKECYIIGESFNKRPTSVHIVASRSRMGGDKDG